MKKSFLLASIALSHLLLVGEEKYYIDEVVTSASGFAQELKDAPASISNISNQELLDKPIRDLGDALSNVAGVSIDQSVGKTGGYNISIRGMPSNYTLILLDGKRQNTSSAGLPNGFSEVFSSFMPPISAIERIEVIRGPASTLYGSDAIGGIVNIVSKKRFQKWGGSISFDTLLQEEKEFGNLYGMNLWASGALDNEKKWSLTLRAKEQYRAKVPTQDLYIIPNNSAISRNAIVGLSQSNNYNIGARLGYSLDEKNYFYLDYDHSMQWYDNSDGLLGALGVNGGYAPNLYFFRNNATFAHEGEYDNLQTQTSLQYLSTLNKGRLITPSIAPSGSELIGKDRDLLGQDVIVEHKSVFGIGDYNTMSVGGQYWFTSLYDRAVPNPFMYQHNASLFVENESVFVDEVFLTLGARVHYNSSFGFNISPRIYLVYQPLKDSVIGDLVFKSGVSTGYKTPSVTQLVKGVNGLSAQGTVPTYGNPKLKPEQSINYELSLYNETSYTQASIGGFFIYFRDKIQSASVASGEQIPVEGGGVCSANSGGSCSYNINADEAISYGVEASFAFKPYDTHYGKVGFSLSYTFNKTKQTSGVAKGLPLTDIPEHSLNGAITYDFWGFDVYLRGEFRAMQLRTLVGTRSISTLEALNQFLSQNPNLSEYYKPHFLLHIGVGYRFLQNYKIGFGIYNLLNQSFIDYVEVNNGNSTTYSNNYNYVREGRRYYLSFSAEF